ncbi:hypothetical protein [Photobacterium angustum]|nr:hypothetical protein [Photobacterium angustum]
MTQHLTLLHEKLIGIIEEPNNLKQDRVTVNLMFETITSKKELINVVISREMHHKLKSNIGEIVAITCRRSYGTWYLKDLVTNTAQTPIFYSDSDYNPMSRRKSNILCLSCFLVSTPLCFYLGVMYLPFIVSLMAKVKIELEARHNKRQDNNLSKKYLKHFISGS